MRRAHLQMAGAAWSSVCLLALTFSLDDNLIHHDGAMALVSAGGLLLQVALLVVFLRGLHRSLRLERRAAFADARARMLHRARYVMWLARRDLGRR